MTNRQLAAQETRKKLIQTAKEIILEKGLTNTSVDEITEKSGVSKGTFYTYFKRKEDIVFELSRGMFDEILESAKAFDGTIFEKLEDYMIHFSAYIEKSGLKLCQEWIKNVVCPELILNEHDKNKLNKDVAAVRELLQYGVNCGDLKRDTPLDLIADTLTDLLYGQMLCWAMSDGIYSFEERTRMFCKNYLYAIIKEYFL
jgi:hypothetical protein